MILLALTTYNFFAWMIGLAAALYVLLFLANVKKMKAKDYGAAAYILCGLLAAAILMLRMVDGFEGVDGKKRDSTGEAKSVPIQSEDFSLPANQPEDRILLPTPKGSDDWVTPPSRREDLPTTDPKPSADQWWEESTRRKTD